MEVPRLELTPELISAISEIGVGGMSDKLRFLSEPNCYFAHYTSADTARKVLDARAFYMRNSRLMNDRSEVWHGFESVMNAMRLTDGGKAYLSEWASLDSALGDLNELVEPEADAATQNCYITSVSEHREPQDHDGLLSMWRAYGSGDIRVAVLAKPSAVAPAAKSGVFLVPCLYGGMERVGLELGVRAAAIKRHHQLLSKIDPEPLRHLAINITTTLAVSIKHAGFEEEREWRFVFVPSFSSSEMEALREAVVLGGVPRLSTSSRSYCRLTTAMTKVVNFSSG